MFQLAVGGGCIWISHILGITDIASQISAHPLKKTANQLGAFANASITPLSESRKEEAAPLISLLSEPIDFQSVTNVVSIARPSATTIKSQPRLNRLSI
jgi:hypothetical protein